MSTRRYVEHPSRPQHGVYRLGPRLAQRQRVAVLAALERMCAAEGDGQRPVHAPPLAAEDLVRMRERVRVRVRVSGQGQGQGQSQD